MTALDDALWPRAALPRRPMLGAVLDALTVTLPRMRSPSQLVAEGRVDVTRDPGGLLLTLRGVAFGYDWTTTDVAEAYELLQARDLIPMDSRSRFVCEPCGGSGAARLPGLVGVHPCDLCDRAGHRPHPPTVAALASWASLGFAAGDDGAPGILGAEELAAAMSPDGAPRWRVAPTGADTTDGSPRAELAALRLLLAGFGWQHRAGRVTLIVPPLGLVTS